jgi:hypothetical protein
MVWIPERSSCADIDRAVGVVGGVSKRELVSWIEEPAPTDATDPLKPLVHISTAAFR